MSDSPSEDPGTPIDRGGDGGPPSIGPRLQFLRPDGSVGLGDPLSPGHPAHQWYARAEELAEWTMKHMVCRAGVIGRYRSYEWRKANPGKRNAYCDHHGVSPPELVGHFRGIKPGDIVGLYSTLIAKPRPGVPGMDDFSFWCKWGAIDIDRHDDSQDPRATSRYALHLYEDLTKLGFRVLLEDSNGDGGYHLILPFARLFRCDATFSFLRWMTRDWARFGLKEQPETFPKQPALRFDEEKGRWRVGNFLRLFGRHHTRDHWSRFYDGHEWLEGERAIEWVLATGGTSVSVIPGEALAGLSVRPKVVPPTRPEGDRRATNSTTDIELVRDALGYLGHRADGYWDWLRVGMALHSMGDEGLPLWEEFSRGSPKYREGVCGEKWAGFSRGGRGLTIASLFAWARETGWVRPTREHDDGEPSGGRVGVREGEDSSRGGPDGDVVIEGEEILGPATPSDEPSAPVSAPLEDPATSSGRREGEDAIPPGGGIPGRGVVARGARAEESAEGAGRGDRMRQLARELGVTEESLAGLGVGFDADRDAWTFPERDGQGRVVGTLLRSEGGRERALPGGRRGLIYATGSGGQAGPVFLVVGGPGVAALMSLGLEAIGLPSGRGGIDDLAGRLAGDDREVVVVGRRDRGKEGPGGTWPGREDAIATALALSGRLGRSVWWTLPPGTGQDIRAWLNGRGPDLEDRAALGALGDELWSALLDEAFEIVPDAVAIRERAKSWREALGRVGGESLWLDSRPCDVALIPALCHETILSGDFGRTLVVCGSREACKEVQGEFRAYTESGEIDRGRRLESAVYPSRTPYGEDTEQGNCRAFEEIEKAHRLGLPPMAAVCQICEWREGCKYVDELERARMSPHAIMTGQRAAVLDLAEEAKDRDAVFLVNGRALDVLVPAIKVELGTRVARDSADWIAQAARRAEENVRSKGKTSGGFFGELARVAEEIRGSVLAGEGRSIPIPEKASGPRGWAASLKGIFVSQGWWPDAKLVKVSIAAAEGRLRALVVRCVGDRVVVQAAWAPRPVGRPTLVLDDTLTRGGLEEAMGEPVEDVGAEPGPRWAVQVPERVTAKKRATAIAEQLNGYLIARPGARIGVVLAAHQREEVAGCLRADEVRRLNLVAWGRDLRGLSGSGLVVVLGHPPVSIEAVMERLVQEGKAEAAAEDGAWGDLPWEAEMPWGRTVTVERRGYRHPEWCRAYRDLVLGRLERALAGLRAPTVVHCAEELGLPLDDAPISLNRDDLGLIDVLRDLTARSATNKNEEETLLVADLADKVPSVSTEELAERAGIPARTVRWRMVRMEGAGIVVRSSPRGGWMLAIDMDWMGPTGGDGRDEGGP